MPSMFSYAQRSRAKRNANVGYRQLDSLSWQSDAIAVRDSPAGCGLKQRMNYMCASSGVN